MPVCAIFTFHVLVSSVATKGLCTAAIKLQAGEVLCHTEKERQGPLLLLIYYWFPKDAYNYQEYIALFVTALRITLRSERFA